jgi:hypothetical protein
MPSNIVIRELLVTDLSQQLKKQRDFLRWMGRRHAELNPDQSQAFFTGAKLFDELRTDLLAGLFNAGQVEELFTREREDQAIVDSQELLQHDVFDRKAAELQEEAVRQAAVTAAERLKQKEQLDD